MAPITTSFLAPRDNLVPTGTTAYYLLLVCTILFFIGLTCIITLAILRKIRSRRQRTTQIDIESKSHRRGRHSHTTSIIITEKSAFLSDSPEPCSPVEPIPEIRLTFPEEQVNGKRQSRVVVVKIGEKGSVGYEPYEESLPVYQEKESQRFQSLDLDRMGGLKEKEMEMKTKA